MKKIDELIKFLFERIDDERIEITVDKKYGHKSFYIKFYPDDEPEDTNKNLPFSITKGWFGNHQTLTIHFDLRNECIHIHKKSNFLIEDKDLLNKWSNILDNYLKEKINSEIDSIINDTFSSCYKKDINREWKMKKILPEENESL